MRRQTASKEIAAGSAVSAVASSAPVLALLHCSHCLPSLQGLEQGQKKRLQCPMPTRQTQDFLLFSQPIIHEGALLSSSNLAAAVHPPPERGPCIEDFTRVGNHLHRVDKRTVTLAGSISLDVGPSAPLVSRSR